MDFHFSLSVENIEWTRAATENPRPWEMEREAGVIFHNSVDGMTVLLSVLLMKSLIT